MLSSVPAFTPTKALNVSAYVNDFFAWFWSINGGDFWKLERGQTFQEVDNPSWDAFARGDWPAAMRLLETRRESLTEYYAEIAQAGFTAYRVRVVELPLSPYLHWELRSLLQRHELGECIRVVSADAVSGLEVDGPLPEMVTLGFNVAYEVLYDAAGRNTGAARSRTRAEVAAWRELIRELYNGGTRIDTFLNGGFR